jgi:hypothetical protein
LLQMDDGKFHGYEIPDCRMAGLTAPR